MNKTLLASAIGGASSRLVLSLMLRKRTVSTKAALKLLDDANAAKIKIDGKDVKFLLIADDDQADPKVGTTVAQKLVDAKVAAVVGISRAYGRIHHGSDVVGGAIVGALLGLVGQRIARRLAPI